MRSREDDLVNSSDFAVSADPHDNYERGSRPLMQPFVDALIEKAELTEGGSILDVACGTGYVARAALPLVGPSGRVAALDVNGPRLAYSRALTADSEPAIEWHEASAEDMPFGDGEFDAVLCQQGLQHFPQLNRAVAEMARVARSDARIAGSIWSPLERQGYFRPFLDACGEHLSAASIDRLRQAFERLPVEAVIEAYESAGLVDVSAEEITGWATFPAAEVFVPLELSARGSLVEEARQLSPEHLTRLTDSVRAALAPFWSGSVHRVPLTSWVVAGTR